MEDKCKECGGTGNIGNYNDVTCYECKGKGYIKLYKKVIEEFKNEPVAIFIAGVAVGVILMMIDVIIG